MNSRQSRAGGAIDLDGLPLGIGAIGLGVLGLLSHDFAFQWQPVPAGWPGHAALAFVSGIVLVLGGATILARRTSLIGAGVLAFWFGLWAIVLHLPVVVAGPSIASALGVAETGAIAMGAAQLLAQRSAGRAPTWVRPGSRILFGLCALVFGTSHFVYAEFTAAMVPGWIPGHLFWAYATGACHVAAGVAILAGVRVWLAGTLLAAMAGGFVLLLHLPRVVATPSSRMEWTMMFVALSIAGAAWIMRLAGKPVRGGFRR